MVRHIQIWAVWRGCRWSQTYIHTSIHTFFICIYIYRSLYIYIHKHIHIDICIYIYIYRSSPYTQTCTYIYIYLCTYIYIYKYIHIHIQIYIYIYIYIYIDRYRDIVACDILVVRVMWLWVYTHEFYCVYPFIQIQVVVVLNDLITLCFSPAQQIGQENVSCSSFRGASGIGWDLETEVTGVFFLGQWKPWLATVDCRMYLMVLESWCVLNALMEATCGYQ